MKRFFFLCAIAVAALGCSDSPTEIKQAKERKPFSGSIPESMKGYEMYSWKENNNWTFTLITGTNRLKNFDEITAEENKVSEGFIKITVAGLNNVKSLLDLVPTKSSIYWISDPSRVEGFTTPPASIVTEIQEHCESLQLSLQFVD